MADVTDEPGIGRASGRAGALVHRAGAAVSLALLGGIGYWGYGQVMRDVTGVPVVRAMEGPMRVAPDNPGGEIAVHAGLAVNAIAAIGEAAPPEDTLLLAPASPGLAPEDFLLPSGEVADVGPVAPGNPAAVMAAAERIAAEQAAAAAPAAPPDRPLTAEEVLALADRISAGVAPLSPLAEDSDAPVAPSVAGEAPDAGAQIAVIPASVPGVSRAPRPPARPAAIASAAGADGADGGAGAADTADRAAPVVLAGDIPAGTTLVQLGAYETAALAAEDWGRLAARFATFMAGKEQVIQAAQSGGRTFYRLRAAGFADLAEARRFCTVLVAEGAACIPVVVR
jgi:hypothetical protein